VSKTTTAATLPPWADDLRRRYLRGESSMFVLHGNVFDVVLYQGKPLTMSEFLTTVLLRESKDNIAVYNVATGLRLTKRTTGAAALDNAVLESECGKILGALETTLIGSSRCAVVIEYAEAIAPGGDPSFQSSSDRSNIVTLHRWSLLPEIEKGDNVIILVTENLTDLAAKIISNPKIAVIEVPMPKTEERRTAAAFADAKLAPQEIDRYAELTAGLKAVQIISILTPPPAEDKSSADREKFIISLLGDAPDSQERASKLAALTSGMGYEEIRKLVAPNAATPAHDSDSRSAEIDKLIARRKREILERECFGLVEFVQPEHGFDVVGGMEEVKKDLLVLAENLREGRTARVPMGILFTGPMGTGKTFVAEAFAAECGVTTIKLKNFRSKWVGATEGNLEKILNVVKAIGQVVVIIDEGDRAFGSGEGESDGGTSSRVIARVKEFMSDTSNRGRILFIVMTNRPDKLDVDLKRAGRLDRKIPFLYSQTPEEVEGVARALVRKNHIVTSVDFPSIRHGFSSKLVGYSNADVEAVILMANDDAARAEGSDKPVSDEHFLAAARDYFPSRDVELLEYMELLAVFEASSRRLLPPKYAGMTVEELDTRMRQLRALVGGRR